MSTPIELRSLFPEEISEILISRGEQKYRAAQIFRWLYRGVYDFSEMTDLSKSLREKLSGIFSITNMKETVLFSSKLDDTKKYLFTLPDGECAESVLMHYKYGYSVCLSTQVGCKMGCRFCASTKAGFVRNLSAGEIISQMTEIVRLNKAKDPDFRISHVVLMGIGEPLDNYDEVIRFIKLINHPDGFNISQRNISLSTCGIVPKIKRLEDEDLQITLSVSLHAPNGAIRDSMMPVNKVYPIDLLIKTCRDYAKKTGRRISFEYALIKEVNDSDDCAKELAALLSGMLCHVNLIPVNKTKETDFLPSGKNDISRFVSVLEKNGINATVRRTLGADIEAACGQLRRDRQKSLQNL